jgi:hypothetical protein
VIDERSSLPLRLERDRAATKAASLAESEGEIGESGEVATGMTGSDGLELDREEMSED